MNATNNIEGVFKTNNQPKIFEAKFIVKKPCHIEVTLADPERPFTAYTVRRKEYLAGEAEVWNIKLPRTAMFMDFSMKISESGPIEDYIDLRELSIEPYRVPKNHFNARIAKFYKLINEFCDKAGYLETNKTYESEDGEFQIEYLDFIPDGNGGIHPTPARIHNTENYIQVSAHHFRGKPIGRRLGIMSHEVAHNFVNSNPDSEDQADMNGAMLFDQLGWNDWDYVYSFTRTFEKAAESMDPNNPNVARNNAINFRRARNIINRYKRKNLTLRA